MTSRFSISSGLLLALVSVVPGCAQEGPAAGRSNSGQSDAGSMAQYIRKKMASCWRLDTETRAADQPVVEIKVSLGPDGALRSAQIVDVQRLDRDRQFRNTAEAARQALFDCQPFDLPPEHYEIWRTMRFHFNPNAEAT